MDPSPDDATQRLEHLARGTQRCRRCPLHEGRLHAVPGEGPGDARIMLVGEAPGAMEDRTGRPFVGPAGRFLDKLLCAHAIDRAEVFITSCVKCRPPGNRKPRSDEVETCIANWLRPQLDVIAPTVVVLLGEVATRRVLGERSPLARVHGTVHREQGRAYLITYHPAAGMRFPAIAGAMDGDFATLARLKMQGPS
jgi:uracil-DNA glycosylase family 4